MLLFVKFKSRFLPFFLTAQLVEPLKGKKKVIHSKTLDTRLFSRVLLNYGERINYNKTKTSFVYYL